MIYEINTSDIPAAFAAGASLIIISGDSQLALVSSSAPIDCIASYDDNQLISVMGEAKWHQPCIDCDV